MILTHRLGSSVYLFGLFFFHFFFSFFLRRYGAWARRLKGGSGLAVLSLDPTFAKSLTSGDLVDQPMALQDAHPALRLVFLDTHLAPPYDNDDDSHRTLNSLHVAHNKPLVPDCTITVTVGGVDQTRVTLQGTGQWQEHWWPLPRNVTTRLAMQPSLRIQSSCTVALHMVEIARSVSSRVPSSRSCPAPHDD